MSHMKEELEEYFQNIYPLIEQVPTSSLVKSDTSPVDCSVLFQALTEAAKWAKNLQEGGKLYQVCYHNK